MLEKMTGKEIVAIIKVCKDSGVKQLTLDGLTIDFRTLEEANPAPLTPNHIHYQADPPASQSNDQQPDPVSSEIEDSVFMLLDPSGYENKLLESKE